MSGLFAMGGGPRNTLTAMGFSPSTADQIVGQGQRNTAPDPPDPMNDGGRELNDVPPQPTASGAKPATIMAPAATAAAPASIVDEEEKRRRRAVSSPDTIVGSADTLGA